MTYNNFFLKQNILFLCLNFIVFPMFSVGYYSTSWLGNTFGYGDGLWVQNHVNSLYVSPDGTCFTQSIWDEGHNENSVYKNGTKIGKLGLGGGLAVGGNGDTIFCASGTTIHSFDRKTLKSISTLKINLPTSAKIYAISARNGFIAISDPNNDQIIIYSANNTKSPIQTISMERPGDIAIDNNDVLWVVQTGNSYAGTIPREPVKVADPKILSYRIRDGKSLAEIKTIENPTSIAIDNLGRLLVCDDGKKQQIVCFKNLHRIPEIDESFFNQGTFGREGGLYGNDISKRGIIADDILYNLAGVGTDSDGNLYVSLGGPAPRGDNPLMDTDLRKYNGLTGKMEWQLLGKEFVDMGDIDPDDLTSFYTKDTHYRLDWSKKEPGSEWSYYARNIDPFNYPHDARSRSVGAPTSKTSTGENVFARRLGKDRRLILQCTGMAGSQTPFALYRFNEEEAGACAIPAVYIDKQSRDHNFDQWPYNIPNTIGEGQEYMWIDANGNGLMDNGEYEINTAGPEGNGGEYPFHGGCYMDSDGGIWITYRERGIRCLPLKGFNEKGVPQYSFHPRVFYQMPKEMTDVHLTRYIGGDEDIMYLAGYTVMNDNTTGSDKPSGVQNIIKYKNWKTKPEMIWQTGVDLHDLLKDGASFEIAGDYIFIGYMGKDGKPIDDLHTNGAVWVLSAQTGNFVTNFVPGPEVGNACGWMDIWDSSLRAYKFGENHYKIFVEDDWHSKTIIYDWHSTGESTMIYPESIELNVDNLKMYESESKLLTIKFAPLSVTERTLFWKSSNPSIAMVDDKGNVKAISPGKATITVKTINSIEKKCIVEVIELSNIYNFRAADPFNLYNEGVDITGQGHGIGFSSKWKVYEDDSESFLVQADRELLSGLEGSHVRTTQKGQSLYFRDLSVDYHSDKMQTYWFSFDMCPIDVIDPSYAGFSLFYKERGLMSEEPFGGEELLLLGYGWQRTAVGFGGVDNDNAESDPIASSKPNEIENTNLTTQGHYLVKIKAQNGSAPYVYGWYNYNGTEEPDETSADLIRRWPNGLKPFNRVRIGHGSSFNVAYDNIRLGLTYQDLSTPYDEPAASIAAKTEAFTLFPTLFSDKVTVISGSYVSDHSILKIIDINGKVVYETVLSGNSSSVISLGQLKSGIYLAVLSDSNLQIYGNVRIIKE